MPVNPGIQMNLNWTQFTIGHPRCAFARGPRNCKEPGHRSAIAISKREELEEFPPNNPISLMKVCYMLDEMTIGGVPPQ